MHNALHAFIDARNANAQYSAYDAMQIEWRNTTPSEAQAIAQADTLARKRIEARQALERRVIRRTVRTLKAAGYAMRVHSGEAFECERTQNERTIMAAVQQTDAEHLYVYAPSTTSATGWARMGSIFLVYGNDGWDVIADHTVNLSEVLEPVSQYADKLSMQA
jgi:hypothetical protein